VKLASHARRGGKRGPRYPAAEQLDLLLLTVSKPRRVHQDGIHFQGFRHLDATLAAYVGEDVVIRYDPRDMAELRVYFHDGFVCRAINPELAGETVALKDIIRARNLPSFTTGAAIALGTSLAKTFRGCLERCGPARSGCQTRFL
jgi:hypothetical protein